MHSRHDRLKRIAEFEVGSALAAQSKELESLREELEDAKSQAQRERDERQKEIGAQEFRGNTISYIYDKCKGYGKKFDEQRNELAELREENDRLKKLTDRCVPPRPLAYKCLNLLDKAGMGKASSQHGNTLTGMVMEVTTELAALRQRLAEAERVMGILNADTLHRADEFGQCLCSQCEFVRARKTYQSAITESK